MSEKDKAQNCIINSTPANGAWTASSRLRYR